MYRIDLVTTRGYYVNLIVGEIRKITEYSFLIPAVYDVKGKTYAI